jgi:hypothetical protein
MVGLSSVTDRAITKTEQRLASGPSSRFPPFSGVTGGTPEERSRLMEMQAADYLQRPHLA